MTLSRDQRRAMKAQASTYAAKMAAQSYDFERGQLVRITAPAAIKALERGFTHLLRNGGEPLAVPLSEAEAAGFPRRDAMAEGVSWLAVGMDSEGRGSYTLQTASSPIRAAAHEAARALALSRLSALCLSAGFPMGEAKGRA